MENKEVIVFGGGCFWCTEAVFDSLKGVISVVPVYTGGVIENPSYDLVTTGKTGHIECVKIEFDPSKIAFRDLLVVFFFTHDPTTPNRQGNDIGNQYASAIFYSTEEQESEARQFIDELEKSKAYDKPVVTEIRPLGKYYIAEDYHQKFYENHKGDPYCELIIAPKLEKLQKRYAELLKL